MSIRSASCAAVAALGLVVSLPAATATAQSETKTEDAGREGEAGLGVAAGLISIVYAPAKVLYAAGGGLVAGMAYVLSAGDQEVTEPILTPSLRGDYVVTPAHLRGERQLEFIGREPEDRALRDEPGRPEAKETGDGLDTAPAASSDASEASTPTTETQ
jgi:hypothetical protein